MMLRFYTSAFEDTATALGLDEESRNLFTLEAVKKQYRECSAFLYVFGLHYYTIRMVEDKAKFATTAGMTESREVVRTLDACGKGTWEVFQNVMDLVNEIEELGTIEVMERLATS